MSNVLKNIKRICKEQRITLASLERRANIGNGTIAKWENQSPLVESLMKVSKALNCTITELVKE